MPNTAVIARIPLRLAIRGTSANVPRTVRPSMQQIAPANIPATIVLGTKNKKSCELICSNNVSKNADHGMRIAFINQPTT